MDQLKPLTKSVNADSQDMDDTFDEFRIYELELRCISKKLQGLIKDKLNKSCTGTLNQFMEEHSRYQFMKSKSKLREYPETSNIGTGNWKKTCLEQIYHDVTVSVERKDLEKKGNDLKSCNKIKEISRIDTLKSIDTRVDKEISNKETICRMKKANEASDANFLSDMVFKTFAKRWKSFECESGNNCIFLVLNEKELVVLKKSVDTIIIKLTNASNELHAKSDECLVDHQEPARVEKGMDTLSCNMSELKSDSCVNAGSEFSQLVIDDDKNTFVESKEEALDIVPGQALSDLVNKSVEQAQHDKEGNRYSAIDDNVHIEAHSEQKLDCNNFEAQLEQPISDSNVYLQACSGQEMKDNSAVAMMNTGQAVSEGDIPVVEDMYTEEHFKQFVNDNILHTERGLKEHGSGCGIDSSKESRQFESDKAVCEKLKLLKSVKRRKERKVQSIQTANNRLSKFKSGIELGKEKLAFNGAKIKPEIDLDANVVIANMDTILSMKDKIDKSSYRHRCRYCEEVFLWPHQLKKHISVKHEGNFPYICPICSKPFDRTSGLKDHMLVHSDKRPFTCDICQKGFKLKNSLVKHKKDLHSEGPKVMFQCEYCSKTFSSKEKLVSHFVVHNEKKQFECKVCQKQFHRKQGLKEHKVVHSLVKNFECPECGLAFNRKYALKVHARNHMAVKPYRCELCPANFTQSHALKNHIRRHTGERPYKCELCNKCFAQQSTLLIHMKRHTGERNFKCGICDQMFVLKRRLEEHVRKHTGEKPFKCDLCTYRGATHALLKRHTETHMRQLQRQLDKEGILDRGAGSEDHQAGGEVCGADKEGIHIADNKCDVLVAASEVGDNKV